MNLNSNSFSAKLYRWFYNVHIMPTNLCPYFWKLVITYVFAIPVLLFSLPYEIIDRKFKNDADTFPERIGLGFVYWLGVFAILITFSPILLLFGESLNGEFKWAFKAAFSVYFIIIFVLFYTLIARLVKILKDKKKKVPSNLNIDSKRKPSILVEFVKAKYNKYCPQIKWENNKTNEENND